MYKRFFRRSLLYIPGSSLKMLGKAKDIISDAVIIDLEDAVSISEKEKAREQTAQIITTLKSTNKEIIVRINAMDSIWGYQDILAIAPKVPDTIIVPKADTKMLVAADMMLGAMERELGLEPYTIGIIALLETTYAIANAYEVLKSSVRINGVQLGAEDLTKEQEIVRTLEGSEILFARQQMAMAARAHGIDIIDTPYTGIKDLDGLRQDAASAKSIGFTGKTCIHPSHIETINEVFSPTAEEVAFSKGVLESFNASLSQGKGACMYQGKMVDAPVAERAKKIVSKAEWFNITK